MKTTSFVKGDGNPSSSNKYQVYCCELNWEETCSFVDFNKIIYDYLINNEELNDDLKLTAYKPYNDYLEEMASQGIIFMDQGDQAF